MRNEILSLTNQLIIEDGFFDTPVANVKIYKTSDYTKSCPFLYDDYLVIVLQGKKFAKIPNKQLELNSQNYLVVPTTLPIDCETIASKEEPFISLVISLDKEILFEIFNKLDINEKRYEKNSDLCLFTDLVTPEIDDIIYRLLKSLQSKNDSIILGELLLRELFYRIILGDKSMLLNKLFLNTSVESKILRIIKHIHGQYNQSLDIDTLSRLEDMSSSSFHSHFKDITSYTPKQYIKKLRLTKAKEMLSNCKLLVNEVAYEIGYESIPQFSTDYKSYFGYAPKDTPKTYSI